MAVFQPPPPSVWPPGGVHQVTGKAAGQAGSCTQLAIPGQALEGEPMQPLVFKISSRASADPVGPSMGFVPSPAPVSRYAANGLLAAGGRSLRRPPAAVAIPR